MFLYIVQKVLLRGQICEYLCFQFKLENLLDWLFGHDLVTKLDLANNVWQFVYWLDRIYYRVCYLGVLYVLHDR